MPSSTSSVKKARANGRAIFLCAEQQLQQTNSAELLQAPKINRSFPWESGHTAAAEERGNLNLAYSASRLDKASICALFFPSFSFLARLAMSQLSLSPFLNVIVSTLSNGLVSEFLLLLLLLFLVVVIWWFMVLFFAFSLCVFVFVHSQCQDFAFVLVVCLCSIFYFFSVWPSILSSANAAAAAAAVFVKRCFAFFLPVLCCISAACKSQITNHTATATTVGR